MAILVHAEDNGHLVPVPLERARGPGFVWIDADGRSAELEALLRDLGIHPLTVEDVFERREVPKVEDFGSYLYVLAHAPRLEDQRLRIAELDLVIGPSWLVTHHPPELQVCAKVRDEWARQLRPGNEPARLAHLILDRLVDESLPVMDAFDDRIEELEEAALRPRPRKSTLAGILATRRSIHLFRRMAVHQREVLLRISRGEFERIPRELLPFFRDVHDHLVRLTDQTDDARDLLNGALEAHLSMVSNRLNEIMKVLTMISTIFLPVTFIAGVYGMNFQHMPELRWQYGYPAVLLLMAATAGGLLHWFRRRGWFD